MQAYVDKGIVAGVSTVLARRGRVVHSEQVGWQDREARTPLSADTIYRVYSMTKPIVCVALMTLYEEGRFQLLDPVSKYLPGFASLRVMTGAPSELREVELARPITIRDLLTHTAGLTYDFLDDSPVGALYRQARLAADPGRSLEAMIAELARLPRAYQPGQRWHYSLAIDVLPYGGYGFGLGSRVLMDVAESGLPGSVGEFGWAGAATTHYWVDPQEALVGVVMAQSMLSFDPLPADVRILAYQAMVG
jgi:CubicO group peptidase (beta-lactamase class C family)